MIKEYLQLQIRILHRRMQAFGLAPVYAYPLAGVLFLVFSFLLFAKSTYAPYLYALMGLLPLSSLASKERSDFLRICFRHGDYLRIRTVENLIAVGPFVGYLVIEAAYLPAFLLLVCAAAFGLLAIPWSFSTVIPTPFGKKPFEFPMGFRRYFGLILGLYFVASMGLRVGNYPLVVFILLSLFATSSSFYSWVEPPYFVWLSRLDEKTFLGDKLRTGLMYGSLLAGPLLVLALLFFPDQWWISFLATFFGLGFLSANILAKYSVFPRAVSLPEALWLTAAVLFPPFLIWLIIHFYRKASKNLKSLLA